MARYFGRGYGAANIKKFVAEKNCGRKQGKRIII
jgi:hypothetical protein